MRLSEGLFRGGSEDTAGSLLPVPLRPSYRKSSTRISECVPDIWDGSKHLWRRLPRISARQSVHLDSAKRGSKLFGQAAP